MQCVHWRFPPLLMLPPLPPFPVQHTKSLDSFRAVRIVRCQSQAQSVSRVLSTLSEQKRKSKLAEYLKRAGENPKEAAATDKWHLDIPECDGFTGAGSVIGVECDLKSNTLRFYLNDKPLCVTPRIERTTALQGGRQFASGEVYQMRSSDVAGTGIRSGVKPLPLSAYRPFIAKRGFSNLTVEFDNEWRPPPSASGAVPASPSPLLQSASGRSHAPTRPREH